MYGGKLIYLISKKKGKSVDVASLGTVQGNVFLTLLVQEQLLHSVLVPNSHLDFIHSAAKNEGTRPFALDSASENEDPVADKVLFSLCFHRLWA